MAYMRAYSKGTKVRMTTAALENYGPQWSATIFTVRDVSTEYMPAKEFYRRGMPTGYHPGYDEAATGKPLYELTYMKDGKQVDLGFSLYWWEVKR